MVGKIKRIRQKLHHGAVKLENAPENRPTLGNLEKIKIQSFQLTKTDAKQPKSTTSDSSNNNNTKAISFPSAVFAGTKISPEFLVQTLKVDEEPSNAIVNKRGELKGTVEKKQQSKKEKMKERRERWLNKISVIKQDREQQAAAVRRRATPVVGDMRPLADALPELQQLLPSAQSQRKRSRNTAETEVSFFSEALKNPTFKTNPLAAIGEHLRKRLKQEDEQS